MLKGINPDYYEARKRYRREDFQKVIKKYPGTGFALAAEKEIKSIDAFDADKQKATAERAKRAAEAEAEQKDVRPWTRRWSETGYGAKAGQAGKQLCFWQ
jgi:hypothetical protein